MKRLITKKNAFTLVELLIVIALIAILSVAVLATINPIEQTNKARDASVQNDAAEVLNAYERYYASNQSYPWADFLTTDTVTSDVAFYSRSNLLGFGLCDNTAGGRSLTSECTTATTPGLLISTSELKNAFLNKPYTKLSSTGGFTFIDDLFLIKQDSSTGNSIYVCYVPKANVNRTATSKLKSLGFAVGADNATAVPTTWMDATAAQLSAATYANLAGNLTLFKCIP